MRTFKRALFSVLCFVCILAVLSALVIQPYVSSNVEYYMDKERRADLSGSLDFLVSGSSHAFAAFNTEILDQELGCSSYNLSGAMMTLSGRYWLLKKELERNPVKTVILEVSYNSMARRHTSEYAEGDAMTLVRLDSFFDRLSYMIQYVHTEDWLNIYSRLLRRGIIHWEDILHGTVPTQGTETIKGFRPLPSNDLMLSEEEAVSQHNRAPLSTDYQAENLERLSETVDLCKAHDVRMIVVVTPISDKLIWTYDHWEGFQQWITEFCDAHGCELYDFNLLRSRYELFNDRETFYDIAHLDSSGADTFTTVLCKVISSAESGEDISELFYSSYDEMKNDSPYMESLP